MTEFVGGSLIVIGGLVVVLLAVVARQLQDLALTLSLRDWRPAESPYRREPVECPVCANVVTPDADLCCPRCASRVAPF